jgi:hypothetical protein
VLVVNRKIIKYIIEIRPQRSPTTGRDRQLEAYFVAVFGILVEITGIAGDEKVSLGRVFEDRFDSLLEIIDQTSANPINPILYCIQGYLTLFGAVVERFRYRAPS